MAEVFRTPSVTADAAVLRHKTDGSHDILMITRGGEPFVGFLAFPGGFCDYNEDPVTSCIRELKEECSVEGSHPRLVTVAGHPDRDPRRHVVTILYRVDIAAEAEVKAADDAANAKFYPLQEVISDPSRIAFDHHNMLKELVA
jgi:8-oxo-dGTP diphosphatase